MVRVVLVSHVRWSRRRAKLVHEDGVGRTWYRYMDEKGIKEKQLVLWWCAGQPNQRFPGKNVCVWYEQMRMLYSSSGANFIELLKQKFCLSTKIARLFYTCYWPKFHAIYIACDWYLAVVYLAYQLSGVLAGNLILLSKVFFCLSKIVCLSSSIKLGPEVF